MLYKICRYIGTYKVSNEVKYIYTVSMKLSPVEAAVIEGSIIKIKFLQ